MTSISVGEAHTSAAFARPGPQPPRSPTARPSDSLVPGPPLRSSLAIRAFTAAPVPPLTGATPETFLPRLPISRLSPEENEGIPGAWAILFERPRRVRTASLGPRPIRAISFVATYPRSRFVTVRIDRRGKSSSPSSVRVGSPRRMPREPPTAVNSRLRPGRNARNEGEDRETDELIERHAPP